MERFKTKAMEKIERRMEAIDEGSLRYRVLQSAKNFKSSWLELGQVLYSVWKDKLYKDWGYLTFDAYTVKEIGVRKETALKLLRSYCFLEKEEPAVLRKDNAESSGTAAIPNYESVNALRLAKNKAIDEADYRKLRKDVIEGGKDVKEVRKDIAGMMRQREELEPEEARRKRKIAAAKRLVSGLKTFRRDVEVSKLLSSGTLKAITDVVNRIELEIGEGS